MTSRDLFAPLLAAALAAAASATDATLIARWDFGPTSLANAPSQWSLVGSAPTLPADAGSGSLLAFTNAFNGTGVQPLPTTNSPLKTPDDGTGAIRLFLSDSRSGVFEFSFSTIGLEDIQFSVDFSRNSSSYTWNGVGVRNNDGFSAGVGPLVQTMSWDRATFDLSGIPEINNQPNVTIFLGGRNSRTNNVVAGGAIDNAVITGSLIIPEPGSLALVGGGLLLAVTRRRG